MSTPLTSPLEQVRAKFSRALYHYDAWHAAFDAWQDSHPYGIERQTDEATGWFILRLRELRSIPTDLALIFSDYVHNLRATLDHVVCQVVDLYGGTCDIQTGFPVETDRNRWEATVARRLAGFPAEWLHVVEAAQPFQFGTRAHEHPLYVLHNLDRHGKHRSVISMAVLQFGGEVTFQLNRNFLSGEGYERVDAPRGTKPADGIELLRVRAISKHGDLRIEDVVGIGEHDFAVGPVSEYAETGGGALPNFLVFVGTVIENISPAFQEGHN